MFVLQIFAVTMPVIQGPVSGGLVVYPVTVHQVSLVIAVKKVKRQNTYLC